MAPLKKMSIPMFELQACLLAVCLVECVKKEMEFKCIKVIFWSDSAVALSWIKMESRLLKDRGGKCIGPWDHWSQKILGFPENILSSHLQNISGKFVHEFPGNILH